MSATVPVLVVGAGCAGLVTALVLAQSGVPVRIIDKEPTFRPGSRGFGIQPRTSELFAALGIYEDIKKEETPIPAFQAHPPGSLQVVKQWTLYPPRNAWPDRPMTNGTILRQSRLEKIMGEHLAKYGVQVEFNTGLVNLEQSKDGVTVTLETYNNRGQPTAERETVVYEYVVGADGARGPTRKLLGLTFEGETRDADGQVWGDVEIEGLPKDYWHAWANPGKWSIIIRHIPPKGGNMFSFGITGQDFDPVDLATKEAATKFILEQTKLDLKFGQWEWISYFKPNMRMVSTFHRGRVWIVGDASHVHSPSGGQGMNTSVQDACNLAWKLSLVAKGLAPRALLNTFDEERLPVITQMLAATSSLYTHMVSRLTAKDEAEPADIGASDRADADDDAKSGWFRWRNDALEQYGVNYRFSNIVLDERDQTKLDVEEALAHAYAGYEGSRTLRAGDRAPDAPGLLLNGQKTKLFDLFTVRKHTVLVYAPRGKENSTAEAAKALAGIPEAQTFLVVRGDPAKSGLKTQVPVLFDKDGYAHDDYLVKDEDADIVVVRPDSFVGAIAKSLDGAKKYFAQIMTV